MCVKHTHEEETKMEQGKVKWFNAEKVLDLSSVKKATTYSYTSQLSKAKVSKHLKKVKK